MLQETIPLYLACDKVLIIKASVRVTSPVNKFEALSNTTRWRRNAIPPIECPYHLCKGRALNHYQPQQAENKEGLS